jgi:hypothetical protein
VIDIRVLTHFSKPATETIAAITEITTAHTAQRACLTAAFFAPQQFPAHVQSLQMFVLLVRHALQRYGGRVHILPTLPY